MTHDNVSLHTLALHSFHELQSLLPLLALLTSTVGKTVSDSVSLHTFTLHILPKKQLPGAIARQSHQH